MKQYLPGKQLGEGVLTAKTVAILRILKSSPLVSALDARIAVVEMCRVTEVGVSVSRLLYLAKSRPGNQMCFILRLTREWASSLVGEFSHWLSRSLPLLSGRLC